ncbi:MAG: NAD(P)-dependent oxidoreductase [Candidatus Aenigmarchaeota archaeon]|nr:NAD(P)-dependent oxidoreductase [Candidatus Aenigmarchaeota archaeon]
MKMLVTGISGQLGYWLAEIGEESCEIFGTYLTRHVEGNNFRIDLSERDSAFSLVERIRPYCVVHCAAASRVEFCEQNKNEAWRVNVTATKNIADACAKYSAKLIFISTDYVFGGREGGMYTEDDIPNPVNYYGKTKMAGEEIALSLPASLVVRPSLIFSLFPGNYAYSILQKLKSGAVSVATDMLATPTPAPELARAILHSAEKDLAGIIHFAGATRISRYEFTKKLAETFGYDPAMIRPAKAFEIGFTAPRPGDTSLDTSKAAGLGLRFPSVDNALDDLKKQRMQI